MPPHTMPNDEQVTRILEKIYAATLNDAFWPEALRAVGGLFGSEFAHFEVLDKKSGIPLYFQNEGADPAALQDYVDHYSAVSPRVAAGKWLAAGAVSCDYDFLTETEMDRDEFYVDFMQPQGYRYFVSANLINDAKTFGVFSVQRRIEQGHVSDGELALMRRLAPHLSQAVRIRMRLAAAESRGRAESFLFEKSATGVVFLGCDGAVQSLNPAAERMIADPGNGIDIRNARLAVAAGREAEAVDRLIARALAAATGTGFAAAGGLAISRPDALPLSLLAVPLPARSAAAGLGDGAGDALGVLMGAPVVALLLIDPSASAPVSEELLRALFGLTPAESRLARALLGGQTLGDYAEQAKIGIRTARTHLSNVLGKTGARNQIALVRLLGGLSYDI